MCLGNVPGCVRCRRPCPHTPPAKHKMLLVHQSVLFVTVLLHVFLSDFVSPRLFHSWSEAYWKTRHIQKNELLGNLVHALVVGSLAAFSVLEHWYDPEALHHSLVPFIAAEISLCFWLTELSTTLVKSPRSLLKDKADLVHHVSGILCLLTALWWQGATMELTVIRLLSQLSVPLLIARILLHYMGMTDTFLYLATFSSMIVIHFLSRVVTIPWYWNTVWINAAETPDFPRILIVVLCILSLYIDVLNIKWLLVMVKTYWKYYPDGYNLVQFIRKI